LWMEAELYCIVHLCTVSDLWMCSEFACGHLGPNNTVNLRYEPGMPTYSYCKYKHGTHIFGQVTEEKTALKGSKVLAAGFLRGVRSSYEYRLLLGS
jgi:hypothetical protein